MTINFHKYKQLLICLAGGFLKMIDSGVSFAILCVTVLVVSITLFYLYKLFKEIFKKERHFNGRGIKGIISFILSLGLMGGIAYCLYHVPDILIYGISWNMIDKWGPAYVSNAVICIGVIVSVIYVYFILSSYFTKVNDKPFFMIMVLSITSGLGNSIIIFIINQALSVVLGSENRDAAIESKLYIFFILGIILFTVSAMIVRKKLIEVTSNVVYEKRIQIIDKILKSSYFKFSSLEEGSAYSALNNDTEVIGDFVNAFVTGFTGIITLLTCFVYLGTMNFYGTLSTILVIAFTVALFLGASRSAEKLFEKNRDFQTVFFKNISDMITGFKELYINRKKRNEFKHDINKNCKVYRDTRMQGEFKFVNVSIMGEMLYVGVIGIVVFTFPLLFTNIQGTTLRNFIVVLLYMGGIVNQAIFYVIPIFVRVRVSWNRINKFIEDISMAEDKRIDSEDDVKGKFDIQLKGVKFTYKNESGDTFTVGPIDYSFKSGESIFIMGGNGSGKTTLAKLLTGLYEPDEGEITINGVKVDSRTLGSYFSTVYSDFYLFDKMYGIDHEKKQDEIQKYLKMLCIADKVKINDGFFSTLKLSTGQRKRLALLVSYLEDRPAYLFDEWAADQDPEFRKFFYKELIPELKARGKAVIAISHDDRYFDDADKLIKMDLGKITNNDLSDVEVAACKI